MKTHVFDLGLITISKWREWFPEKKRCVRLGSRTPDSPILVFHSTTNPTSHWLQRDPSEESGSLQRESESNCCNSDLHIVVVSLWSSMIPLSLSFLLGFMTNLGLFFSLQNIWSKIWWNSSFSLFSRFEDLKAWIQPVFSLPLIKNSNSKSVELTYSDALFKMECSSSVTTQRERDFGFPRIQLMICLL